MRKLIRFAGAGRLASTGAAMLTAGAGPASAQATTTTTTVASTPVQGAHGHQVVVYADTVTGGGTPKPVSDCLEETSSYRANLSCSACTPTIFGGRRRPDRHQHRGRLRHRPGRREDPDGVRRPSDGAGHGGRLLGSPVEHQGLSDRDGELHRHRGRQTVGSVGCGQVRQFQGSPPRPADFPKKAGPRSPISPS